MNETLFVNKYLERASLQISEFFRKRILMKGQEIAKKSQGIEGVSPSFLVLYSISMALKETRDMILNSLDIEERILFLNLEKMFETLEK
ncbi:MAG: hypothetical protein J7L07_08000 [Candidatus Odinarchaeota archaeon]|nr:hypothetical protein [Candidatus Odinarchaeota archaeon]